MFIWKRAPTDANEDWHLVDEINNSIIAFIMVSENHNGTYNAESVCKKIGYTARFENIDKNKIKTVISDLKKSVMIELHHLREGNEKPTDKKIYDMIDSIPVWKYLKNGNEEIKIQLRAEDYGEFAEILGNKLLGVIIRRGGILDNIYPDIEIKNVHVIKNFAVRDDKKVGLGDVVVEISYKKDDLYGKKIAVFEIKHGKFLIKQNQLRRYCSMILKPGEFFHKADEVKIIYMLFDKIDTLNAVAFYSIKELDRDFAKKIMEQEPTDDSIYKYDEIK